MRPSPRCPNCGHLILDDEALPPDPDFDDVHHLILGVYVRPKLWELSSIFRRRPNRILSSRYLSEALTTDVMDAMVSDDCIKYYIHFLRVALRNSQWKIKTIWGSGYVFEKRGGNDVCSSDRTVPQRPTDSSTRVFDA